METTPTDKKANLASLAACMDCQSGEENVWVVDAGLSYRMPKRYGLFTVGARNLFNENFQFQETDLRNPTVSPKRLVFMQLTFTLP